MNNLAEVRHDVQVYNAEIRVFPGVRVRKDGKPKRTPNNNSIDRWCDPIRDRHDIKNVSEYLLEKTKTAKRKDTMLSAYRNRLLFIIGINVGVRVSDLVTLQWKNFFEEDMETFVDIRNKKEKKTGKKKEIVPNECIMRGIEEYIPIVKELGIIPKYNDYIFLNSRTKKPITDAAVEDLVKNFSKECKLKGRYNTHSLRKTYAYQKFMNYVEHGELPAMAIAKVQKDLNHSSPLQTLEYLGITRQERIESSIDLGEYLMDSIVF